VIYDSTLARVPKNPGTLDRPPASKEPEHDYDQGDHQQDVDQSTGDLQGKPEQPQQKQDNDDGPEHELRPPTAFMAAEL
jgi:hypothetical protein